MRRSLLVVGASALLLLGLLAGRWWPAGGVREDPAKPDLAADRAAVSIPVTDSPRRMRAPEPVAPRPLTAEEKTARVDKIKRDYDEIRLKASADYSAAGASFPGGLHAFLRQLALLEREKRADLAVVLSPRELEDLEMSETSAGQLVERLLGPTAATVEQRRTVFQLQRSYEEKFAMTYDLSARALYEREAARQQVQQQISAVLGDDLFGSWLFGEGEDYALFVAFAARNGLAVNAPIELRQLKNEFTLRRLEINAQPGSSPEQMRAARDALARQIEARVVSLIGPVATQAGRDNVLGWLPKP